MSKKKKQSQIKFYKLLEEHLNVVLKDFFFQPLTPAVLREIRNALRTKIENIFTKSKKHRLTAEAMTWLTDQYFKSIQISPDQLISDNVVINEYTLLELTFSDIQLLWDLFKETKMGPELECELQRRNNAS